MSCIIPFGGGENRAKLIDLEEQLRSINIAGVFTTNDGMISDPANYFYNRIDCNKIYPFMKEK